MSPVFSPAPAGHLQQDQGTGDCQPITRKVRTMAVNKKDQENVERIVFQLFAEAARLPIILGSIKSESPPAPDILCEIKGRGLVAFELVQIVTPALIRGLEDDQKLRKAFKAACKQDSAFAVKFHDALILAYFLENIPIRQRLSVVPEVVSVLRQHSETFEGDIRVPRHLRKVLTEILVTRRVSGGPTFSSQEMTEHTEEIFRQFEKKCKKKYSNHYPIELLAYYTSQPASANFNWRSEFHDYVLKRYSDCPFERVWVYDNWSKTIKYVHPVPAGKSRP